MWTTFFENAPADKYSILYHSKFEENDQFPDQMRGLNVRKVPHVDSEWGDMGQVRVQIQLMRYAVADASVRKIIYVSQSCIPLYDFDTLYEKIMGHDFSMFEITPREQRAGGRFPRYDFLLEKFHSDEVVKHSNWIVLIRKHAQYLVENEPDVIGAFEELAKENVYSPDESVIGTSLARKGWLHEIANHIVIHANWCSGGIHHFDQFTIFDLQQARLKGAVIARKMYEDVKIDKAVR